MGFSHAALHGARNCAGQPLSAFLRENGRQTPELALTSYLEAHMATLAKEQVRVLFFNAGGDAIADERIWPGTATYVDLSPGELVRHAIACDSPALLLAHNHPSGLPQPSKADVEFTRRLVRLCKELQIRVHDHIIVSRNGSFSFRELGYM